MTQRTEKVSSVVQKCIATAMQELDLPFLTTILKVEISEDLKYGKIWISVLPAGEKNEQQILDILKKNIYDLQGQLNHTMQSKIVPRISFAIDHSQEYSSHINELIAKTHDQDQ